jgi:hypothetical protein
MLKTIFTVKAGRLNYLVGYHYMQYEREALCNMYDRNIEHNYTLFYTTRLSSSILPAIL